MPRRSRRRVLVVLVVAVVACVVVCKRSVNAPPRGGDWAHYHDKTFRVTRVVDGDTLDINVPDRDKPVTRVRLWGVDTPEVAHGRQKEMHFGPEAEEFARSTLLDRDVHIVLTRRRTRGKFGRLLAYVFLKRGERMFNEMLIEEGYAYADLRFDHPYYKQFKAMEKRARRVGVGLWANVKLEQMPAWKQRFERAASVGGD